jgi:biopolymer transport protein TolR
MTTTRGKAELNVTPLIDVLLVLLIIFMVMNPTHSTGLPNEIPQEHPAAAPDQANPATVVVHVFADGALQINGQPTERAILRARLDAIYRTRAERVLFISGDDETEFALVAGVIDIARSIDITHVALIKRAPHS